MDITTYNIQLNGLSDIMFDQFFAQEKDTRPPEQKFYLSDNKVVLPAENINSFLFSEKGGCAKTFEGKKGKDFIRMGQSHLIIKPMLIPFTRNGKPIVFSKFDDKTFYVSKFAPVVKMSGGGFIKQNMKLRPVLKLPWELKFQIDIVENTLINENRLYNWFSQGGILIALGTYRPRFGRFSIDKIT
jgi:hypothetical protein